MKKVFILMVCFVAAPAMADFYYGGHTQNCDMESMRAALDSATIAGHGAVITTIDCTESVQQSAGEYVQEYDSSEYDYRAYDNIETANCVPGPIVNDLPESDCDLCY